MLKLSIRMGKKRDLSVFERSLVVGARWAGLSLSESADLLGFTGFGVKNMKSSVQVGADLVMVWYGGTFSWPTLGPLVPTEHWLNATACLGSVAGHIYPFMTTVDHRLPGGYCTVSQSSDHPKLVSGTWQWIHCTPTAFILTRSKSNRAPLRWDGTGATTLIRSAATVWRYHVTMDWNPRGPFPSTYWKFCTEQFRQFWRQNWVQPFPSDT